MTKVSFIAVPQRSDGRGFTVCEIHRATSFAVIKRQQIRLSSGKRGTISRFVSRHPTLTLAQSEADYLNRSLSPLLRSYKLGRRMEKRTVS